MEPNRHLEILRCEGERLASVPPESLDAPVPAVPGWTVELVLRHTGKVHQWVTALLQTGGAVDRDELAGIGAGTACIDGYRAALEDLLRTLEAADPSAPVFTFAGPGDASFWMRRQAHEVSVHRMDATDAIAAAGGPASPPLVPDACADGIDEWATLFLANRYVQRVGTVPADLVGHTVHIHGTDDPAPADGAEWLLRLGEDAIEVETTHAKGDVVVRGTSPDLLLTLWRRRPLDSVEVIGDRSVAERLLEAVIY